MTYPGLHSGRSRGGKVSRPRLANRAQQPKVGVVEPKLGGKAPNCDCKSEQQRLQKQVEQLQGNLQITVECFGLLIDSTASLTAEVHRLSRLPAAAGNTSAASLSEIRTKIEPADETSTEPVGLTAASCASVDHMQAGGTEEKDLARQLGPMLAQVCQVYTTCSIYCCTDGAGCILLFVAAA